ncbi:MAG: protein-L-isoaspartate(D-aspartate) O-methyltransferase [Pseudomonadales bacterium]
MRRRYRNKEADDRRYAGPISLLSALMLLLSAGASSALENDKERAFASARHKMVRDQIARDGIEDPAVLKALATVPRHRFVPERHQKRAYADTPLPIGRGQTISQPYMVAAMTELIQPQPRMKVLEIGTGSGYQAAVLAHIVDQVFTIEIIESLAKQAKQRLQQQGYTNIAVKQGDGYFGWEEYGPFDAIIVTAAAEYIPPPLLKQLKKGGRMVIPVGSPYFVQRLMLVDKKLNGQVSSRSVMVVSFVPFTREK